MIVRVLCAVCVCLCILAPALPARAETFDQLVAAKCPNGALLVHLNAQIGTPTGYIQSDRLRSLFRSRAVELHRCAAATTIPFLHDGALIFSLRDASSGLETNGDVIREDPKIIAALKNLAARARFTSLRSLALAEAAQVQGDLARTRTLVGH